MQTIKNKGKMFFEHKKAKIANVNNYKKRENIRKKTFTFLNECYTIYLGKIKPHNWRRRSNGK